MLRYFSENIGQRRNLVWCYKRPYARKAESAQKLAATTQEPSLATPLSTYCSPQATSNRSAYSM